MTELVGEENTLERAGLLERALDDETITSVGLWLEV